MLTLLSIKIIISRTYFILVHFFLKLFSDYAQLYIFFYKEIPQCFSSVAFINQNYNFSNVFHPCSLFLKCNFSQFCCWYFLSFLRIRSSLSIYEVVPILFQCSRFAMFTISDFYIRLYHVILQLLCNWRYFFLKFIFYILIIFYPFIQFLLLY